MKLRFKFTNKIGENTGELSLRHPRDVPSVDPSTLGQKTLYELASLKYCYTIIWSHIIRQSLYNLADRRAVGVPGLGAAAGGGQGHQAVHPARQEDRLHRRARLHHGHVSEGTHLKSVY